MYIRGFDEQAVHVRGKRSGDNAPASFAPLRADKSNWDDDPSPSPGTPGEGRGEGEFEHQRR